LKPNTAFDSVRKGDLGGDRIEMGLDYTATAHIMSILTDLYSDPELAVIREYSTNARDAHIEAGCPDRPIEITLPTRLAPFFTIRDFGVGMDHDTIAQVYSKYGASTKRGGNEQTGMLGLGGKSALTYTNQFTVIGIKNGVKTTVVVSRNDDGGGVMQVVDTCATDEGNGVTITVPAKGYDFTNKVHGFFRYWPKGSVKIDGKPNSPATLEKVSDSTFIDREGTVDYVIMGGVSYPVAHNHRREIVNYRRFGVVIFADMGEVNFTPSREELHYTSLTVGTLTKYYDEFTDAIFKQIQDDVDASKNFREAFTTATKWRNLFGTHFYNPTYKGQDIPVDSVSLPEGTIRISVNNGSSPKYSTHIGKFRAPVVANEGYIFIHGLDKAIDKITTYDRNRLNKWAENEMKCYGPVFHLIADTDPDTWGDDWHFDIKGRSVSWEVIKAYKPPRTSNSGEKSEPRYSVYSEGEALDITKSEIQDLISSGNMQVLYFSPSNVRLGYRESKDRSSHAHNAARHASKLIGAVVCVIGENRWEKFTRDFPMATRLEPAFSKWFNEQEKAITREQHISLAVEGSHYMKSSLKALRKYSGEIDDPDLVTLGNATTVTLSDYIKNDRALAYRAGYRLRAASNEYPDTSSVIDTGVMKRYPLISITAWQDNAKDATIYVNAKYATLTKDAK
jgi:hypothetical protein